jgi:nitrogen-specific signal transduction histidine kinase/DNA-binding response OmpR family regulator
MNEQKRPPSDPRVLLISGDDPLASRLERELVRTGIVLSQWRPGQDAPETPLGGYHLVVLDLDDPAQTREFIDEAVASTRRHSAGVAVFAVAKDPSRDDLLHLLDLSVDRFIRRPVDLFETTASIREACHRSAFSRFSAEIFHRLKDSHSVLDRSQLELHDAIVRSNEELQTLNRRLYKVVSQLKTLYHMGRDLAENENWSDALDRFLMALVSFMGADGAALLLFSYNNSVLATRSSFQIDQDICAGACAQILSQWKRHTRSTEIHSLESYGEGKYNSCLEGESRWRMTLIPLRHRNRPLGFLLLEKDYKNGHDFKGDYDFLSTLQTIFVEEIANASYISELRHLSRFNNKVLDNIRSGVITTDLEGKVNYSNEWARGMCPDLRGPKPKPIHFDELFESRQFGGEFYDRVIKSQKNSHVLEVVCRGGAQELFPARLRTAKMYDDNLDGMVIVAIFEDLTEQRRMEAEIRRNDRLRVLGHLSAGVAHEIRNPLTGIATSAEVLADRLGKDDNNVKYIRAILDEIHRLDGIIRNLLDFARPPKPQLAPCSLPEIVQRVISLLSEEASKKGVDIRLGEDLEAVFCEADSSQITQVLLNVVKNAVQACNRGDEVQLNVMQESASDASYAKVVRIDVLDSGPGVPREVRESLFDPFVTTKTKGTGLGLAISQHIVEEHNGSIACDFLSRGTRFSIRLPQREAVDLEEPKRENT